MQGVVGGLMGALLVKLNNAIASWRDVYVPRERPLKCVRAFLHPRGRVCAGMNQVEVSACPGNGR